MNVFSKVKTMVSDSWMKVLAFTVLCAVSAMAGVFVQVDNQSELDQQRLSWTGEQQVMSQRIAKYALAAADGKQEAFVALEKSRERFMEILDSESSEFGASESYRMTPEYQAFTELDNVWHGFSYSVEEVVDGQILVLSVAETASLTREIMPELMQHTQGLVDNLVRNNASPRIIWLDGVWLVPSAWRTIASTITIRVNDVIMSNAAGSSVNTVMSASIWIVRV